MITFFIVVHLSVIQQTRFSELLFNIPAPFIFTINRFFMADTSKFLEAVQAGYVFKGDSVKLGVAMLNGQVVSGADVNLPLKMMNRHGLIAGATGTGKTKTLQLVSELLSDSSVPVVVMDIKGDLSGIAEPGTVNDKITDRAQKLNITYKPTGFPTELMTLSTKLKGVQLRATVTEFGPILFSKILGLNDTQQGMVAMLFKYADEQQLPLLDLKDFKKLLQWSNEGGKAELEKDYGKLSTTSTGTILRKVIELEQQGADTFFGEKSFEVEDLMRINEEGLGMISVLRLMDLQDRPKLFSSFMLQMLAELYAVCPEEGDLDKPKLVMFIDEAHLIFNEASQALIDQIQTIIKLIRSKGIGIFFCTQNPMDVPAPVLGQLGMKVQHALRAFTAADRKVIKQTAENYPETTFYQTDELLTQVGIGEALVTMLNEKGIPTPLVHVMLCPPRSRMDVLTEAEVDELVSKSKLARKYNTVVDSESAYEILKAKMEEAAQRTEVVVNNKKEKERPGMVEQVLDNTIVKSALRTAATTLTRSLLGALGLGGRSRKKSSWF